MIIAPMQWSKTCQLKGVLRKQFSQWRVAGQVIQALSLEDGDECRIIVRLQDYEHVDEYRLSSDREFRVSSEVSGRLRSIAVQHPDSRIEFRIFDTLDAIESDLAKRVKESQAVGRQLLFPVDDNYFSLSTTITSFTN
jgi:hypothetical protein